MKRILLIFGVCCIMTSCNWNNPFGRSEFVYDEEEVLEEIEEEKFTELFDKHEERTSNEIVLVTTDDREYDDRIMFFAYDFGEKKNVGKMNKANGVVIAFSRKNREVYIAPGKGIEDILNDEVTRQIIDSLMLPQFRERKYFEGLMAGSREIVKYLEKPENRLE